MAYPISKWIIQLIYRPWIRKVEGLENIPKDKPFIIAANHTSYFDALLLPVIVAPIVNKKIHALVNSYYWKNPITRFFLDLWENVPVFVEKEKNTKKKNKQAFEKALRYIKKDELIMIFPEGKRSPNGKLQKAKTGVARLALISKAPVLSIGIIDAYKVLPRGAIFPRLVRCEVKIAKPIYFEKYYNKKMNDELFEYVTRSIMKQIARLIGQKYNY